MTQRVTVRDGTELFVRNYQSSSVETSRSLLIVHGVCEHGGRYDHVAEAGAVRGWNVIICDLRGHGHSEGHRAHVGRFRDYLHDLRDIAAALQLQGKHTAVLGHSMGGLVAIRFAQLFPESLSALAVTGPLLGVGRRIHPLTLVAGRLLSFVAPRTRFATGVKPEHVSRDSEILQRRAEDPLMQQSVTAAWYFQVRAAMKQAWKQGPQLKIPLFVLQGALDQLVDPIATERWIELVGGQDKKFELFRDHVHELLNEPDREETIELLLDWFDGWVPPSS